MKARLAPNVVVCCIVCWLVVSASAALAEYRVVWGDVHGHTDLSDGKGSLDDYFTCARDEAKLDFVIVTDHDFGHGPPWRMPKEDWRLTQEKADQYTANGRFVAIAGYEWTSQEKYWTGVTNAVSERLFPGPPKHYNHKNVYFLSRVDYLFSSKDAAYQSPNQLAEAVRRTDGLIHNCHPSAAEAGRNQFDYDPAHAAVIANTEMMPDVVLHNGKAHDIRCEQVMREFLNRGVRTGFVAGTDTHEGKPAARTAVLVRELTRSAIFDALRRRRCYAINHARIALDFRINGRVMGEEVESSGQPQIIVEVKGTAPIEEVAIIRDGAVLYSLSPRKPSVRFTYTDHVFGSSSYYYVRVVQADVDKHGNRSHAWSSPIWVTSRRAVAK